MRHSFILGMTLGALIAMGGVVLGRQLREAPQSAAEQAAATQAAATQALAQAATPAAPGGGAAARAFELLVPSASAARPEGGTAAGPDRGGLVATYGVGGVLTRDGELWQYRPDRSRWLTLDESFTLEGKATKLVPLPVAATDVKIMETFGFLVTRQDECWLYDLDKNVWNKIGAPPFKGQGR